MHQCPATSCVVRVRDEMLMCKRHWFMVDKPLRDEVWAAYDHGRGIGSERLERAQRAAIEYLEAYLAERAASA